jgi:hypothetical protein
MSPPNEYTNSKREQLRQLANNIAQSNPSKNQISQQREEQARELEDQTKAHLDNIVQGIVTEDTSDISLLQRKYDKEVEYVIRSAVTSSYIIGINYVGSTKKRLHHVFLTRSDIEKIKQLTAEFAHIFWRRVGFVVHSKDTVQNILKGARFSHRSTLSINHLITILAVKIVTKTLAVATILKLKGMSNTYNSYNLKSAQATERVVWKTEEDNMVCLTCQMLEGQTWNIDDPTMPIPGDEGDIHENCRCRLNVVSDTGEDTGQEATPDELETAQG